MPGIIEKFNEVFQDSDKAIIEHMKMSAGTLKDPLELEHAHRMMTAMLNVKKLDFLGSELDDKLKFAEEDAHKAFVLYANTCRETIEKFLECLMPMDE